MSQIIMNRSDIVAFAAITETTTSGGTETTTTTNYRMTKFSKFSPNKNAKEYNRQYVDEIAETSDVVGYAPAIDYSFDAHTDNPVHNRIKEITDKELICDRNDLPEFLMLHNKGQNIRQQDHPHGIAILPWHGLQAVWINRNEITLMSAVMNLEYCFNVNPPFRS